MEDLERYPEGTSAGFALSGIIGSTVQVSRVLLYEVIFEY